LSSRVAVVLVVVKAARVAQAASAPELDFR
jgi:hypothetical protein